MFPPFLGERRKKNQDKGEGIESAVSPSAVYLTPLRGCSRRTCGGLVFFYGTVDAALSEFSFGNFALPYNELAIGFSMSFPIISRRRALIVRFLAPQRAHVHTRD